MSDNKSVPITVSPNPQKTRVWINKDGKQLTSPRGQEINESKEEEA